MNLDKFFFPKLERKRTESPVFIIGSFRSGTTFLQRLMGMDTETFSTAMTWELLLAPSVLQRKLLRGIFAADSVIGKPVRKLFIWAEGVVLDDRSAHKMGLKHHEEDEAFFIHLYASAFLVFAMPYFEDTDRFYKYDSVEAPHRRRLEMEFYHDCIQRHMYAHPEASIYLSKSPTFTPRIQSLLNEFPQARFIYLARHPLDVLPSLMQWFTEVWSSIEKTGIRFPYKEFVIDFVRHWYVDALELIDTLPRDHVKILKYDDLVSDPFHTVESLYSWLGISMPEAFSETLSHEKARAKKHWKQKVHNLEIDNINAREIYRLFEPVFTRFNFSLEEYE